MTSLETKLNDLRERIKGVASCAVAFSGGVDSTLVLKVAHEALGDRVIAVTALSESLPGGELGQAGAGLPVIAHSPWHSDYAASVVTGRSRGSIPAKTWSGPGAHSSSWRDGAHRSRATRLFFGALT